MNNMWKMKLKVALDYRMSVWMLPGVKSGKMTHWRGIYRQLTRIEPLDKSCQKKYSTPVNPMALQKSSSVQPMNVNCPFEILAISAQAI